MTDAQPTAEDLGKRIRVLRQVYDREHPTAQWSRAHAGQLFNIITDLRASLCREENARKVLADENERLRARLREAAQDAREDARDAAAEERWKEQQGVDYGTY